MRLRSLSVLVLCLLAVLPSVHAQRHALNMPEHDNKAYYFGLTFGLNFSQYRVKVNQTFATTDTFRFIQPSASPGFNLGLMGNLRLNKFVDLRLIPSLAFAGKTMEYNEPRIDTLLTTKTLESIYLHLPLQAKFKSDRIRNFRFYGLVGGKFDYDLAANARSRRRDEWLKVKPVDLGAEIGVGFEFYNPNFIFSPEIKLSQGLTNQIFKGDKSIPLTNAIDELRTRTIVISIHLEG